MAARGQDAFHKGQLCAAPQACVAMHANACKPKKSVLKRGHLLLYTPTGARCPPLP